jgi:hypothetical protein
MIASILIVLHPVSMSSAQEKSTRWRQQREAGEKGREGQAKQAVSRSAFRNPGVAARAARQAAEASAPAPAADGAASAPAAGGDGTGVLAAPPPPLPPPRVPGPLPPSAHFLLQRPRAPLPPQHAQHAPAPLQPQGFPPSAPSAPPLSRCSALKKLSVGSVRVA